MPHTHKEVRGNQKKDNFALQWELNLTDYKVGRGKDVHAFFKSAVRFTCDFLDGDYAGLLEKAIKVHSSDGYTKEHIIT